MVNPQNSREKKEHFGVIGNIIATVTSNPLMIGLSITIVVLIIGVIVYFIMQYYHKTQAGAGMDMFSDYAPMTLTNTPAM